MAARNNGRKQSVGQRNSRTQLRASWSGSPLPPQFAPPTQFAPPAQTAYGVSPFPVGYALAAGPPARKVSGAQIFKPTIAPGYTGAPIAGGPFGPQQQGAGAYFAPQAQAAQQQHLALQPTPLVPFVGPASQPAFTLPPHISGVNPNPQGLQFNHQRAKSSPFPGAQILPSNPRLEQPAPAAIALSPQNGSAAAAANVTPASTNANAEQQRSMPLTPAPNSVGTLRAKYLGWNVVECLYGAEFTLPVVYKMLPQHKVSDREFELIPDAHFDFFEKGYLLTIYTRTRNPRFEAVRQVGAPAQEPEFLVQKSIEPFVDEDRVLYTVRPEAPHDRVVGLIQYGLRQDSKRKVHLLLYLCETPDVAAALFDQFRRLGDGPEKLVNIKNLEGQLIDEGQLSTHSKELLRAVAAPCEPSDNRQRDKQDVVHGELVNLFKTGAIASIVLPRRDYPEDETPEDAARRRLADNQDEPLISPNDSGNGDPLRIRLRHAPPPVAPKPSKIESQPPNNRLKAEAPAANAAAAAVSEHNYSSVRKLTAPAAP